MWALAEEICFFMHASHLIIAPVSKYEHKFIEQILLGSKVQG
jgi:hypothetical protein